MTNDPHKPSGAYEFVPALGDLRDRVTVRRGLERPNLAKRDRQPDRLCRPHLALPHGRAQGHFNRAIANGVTKEELQEVITHLAFYAGWPNAVNAARVFGEVSERARHRLTAPPPRSNPSRRRPPPCLNQRSTPRKARPTSAHRRHRPRTPGRAVYGTRTPLRRESAPHCRLRRTNRTPRA